MPNQRVFSRRFLLSIFVSAVASYSLLACGGGGGDERVDPAFPAWTKGGTIALNKGSITITFDLSQGHLLGLGTKNLATGKDDPTRIIKPEEVREVVFTSVTLGGPKDSPARAPWNASGVVTLPHTASADANGYFFVILKMGEEIPLAMSADKSRYAVTGGADIVVGGDGSLQYGNYHLGSIVFTTPGTLRIDFGADFLGGLSGFVNPADVSYFQWISELTYWYDSPARGTLAVATNGDYYVDIKNMPNNDQGYIVLWLKNGIRISLNPKSPRWGLKTLNGITLL